jgi:hypothetical protein
MPGELGNEVEQQSAGYRENQYKTRGEMGDGPIDPEKQETPKPKSNTIIQVLKLVREQGGDEEQ